MGVRSSLLSLSHQAIQLPTHEPQCRKRPTGDRVQILCTNKIKRRRVSGSTHTTATTVKVKPPIQTRGSDPGAMRPHSPSTSKYDRHYRFIICRHIRATFNPRCVFLSMFRVSTDCNRSCARHTLRSTVCALLAGVFALWHPHREDWR